MAGDLKNMEQAVLQLRRGEKNQLIGHLARSSQGDPIKSSDEKRSALLRLRSELSSLSIANPEDGTSNRDHNCLSI